MVEIVKEDPIASLKGVVHELPKIPTYADDSLNEIIANFATEAKKLLDKINGNDIAFGEISTRDRILFLINEIDNTKNEWIDKAEQIRNLISRINENSREQFGAQHKIDSIRKTPSPNKFFRKILSAFGVKTISPEEKTAGIFEQDLYLRVNPVINDSILEKEIKELGSLPLDEQIANLTGISYLLKNKLTDLDLK